MQQNFRKHSFIILSSYYCTHYYTVLTLTQMHCFKPKFTKDAAVHRSTVRKQ